MEIEEKLQLTQESSSNIEKLGHELRIKEKEYLNQSIVF